MQNSTLSVNEVTDEMQRVLSGHEAISSPLIRLLDRIALEDRYQIFHIKLHPDLGYTCLAHFPSAQDLLAWLRPVQQVLNRAWPAEAYRLKDFRGQLALDILLKHAACFPGDLLVRYRYLTELFL